MLRFDLEDVLLTQFDIRDVAWPDIRVSKQYFEKALRYMNWLKDDTQLEIISNIILNGDFKSQNKIKYNPNM